MNPVQRPLDKIVELDERMREEFANMNRAIRNKYEDLGIDNKTAVMGFVEREGKGGLNYNRLIAAFKKW